MQIMYKIEIHTPFGICPGWMMIQTENNDAVDGYLAVLNQIQPFFGHVEASGRLTLNCKLATRAQIFRWKVPGSIWTVWRLPGRIIMAKKSQFRIAGAPEIVILYIPLFAAC